MIRCKSGREIMKSFLWKLSVSEAAGCRDVGTPQHTHTHTHTHTGVRIFPVKHQVLHDQQIPNHCLKLLLTSLPAEPPLRGGWRRKLEDKSITLLSASLQTPADLTSRWGWEVAPGSRGSIPRDKHSGKITTDSWHGAGSAPSKN